ncbi:MAG: hypothetical protein WDW38_007595 [Sanguina aurantia]
MARTDASKVADKSKIQSGLLQPTNYDMLVFRALNRDLKVAGANDDYLAEKLRDELVPVRSWCMKNLPGANSQIRRTSEHPVWGIPGCVHFVDARTSWLDRSVKDAIEAGITQVVLVAAGFDTRAYRLHSPAVTFFEVDLPHASSKKQQLVQKLKLLPAEARAPTYVGADLSEQDLSQALSGSAFSAACPTLYIIEGLIYYLPAAAVGALFRSISALAAPGSTVCFDFLDSAALEKRVKFAGFKTMAKIVASKNEPLISSLGASSEAIRAFAGSVGLTFERYISPKDMAAATYPAMKWNNKTPPIISFFNFAVLSKGAQEVEPEASQ